MPGEILPLENAIRAKNTADVWKVEARNLAVTQQAEVDRLAEELRQAQKLLANTNNELGLATNISEAAGDDHKASLEAELDQDIIAEWDPNEDKSVLPPKEILLAKEPQKTKEELIAESDKTLEENFKANGIDKKPEQNFYTNARNELVANHVPVERATSQVEEWIDEDRYHTGVSILKTDK